MTREASGDRATPRIGSPANLLGIARTTVTPVVIGLMLVAGPGSGLARAKHPRRRSRDNRDWSLLKEVWLNRPTEQSVLRKAA